MARPSHAFTEHTGEVALSLEAPSLVELFVEAGRALAELLAEEPPAPDGPGEPVEVRAPDRGRLLVGWLNELVFLSETRKRVFTELRIDRLEANRLEATVRGAEPKAIRTAVKAATLHGLSLEERGGGFVARVVLDV